MSLEQTIAENTAAIQQLIQALLSSTTTALVAAVDVAAPADKPAAKAAAPKVETKAADTKVEVAPASVAIATFTPDYAPVGAAITAYATTNGRDATIAKLGTLGVKSGKELKPEQYAAALALFTTEEEVA